MHPLVRRAGGNGKVYEFLRGDGQPQHHFKRLMSNWPNTQERDPPNTQVQSIDIDFIGTCAMVPSKTRNTSSLRVQIQGRSWIFDAGENTQVNFQKFGVSPQKIDKIFITHTHGDHILGLPGILMGIKQCRDSMIKQRRDMLKFESDENTYYQKNIPIDIYGPRGLRAYLRAFTTYTKNCFPRYRVHELHDNEHDSLFKSRRCMDEDSSIKKSSIANIENKIDSKRHDERNIVADEDGLYRLCKDDSIEVIAGRVQHTAPTYGFVLLESKRMGNVNGPLGKKIFSEHAEEIKKDIKNRDEFYGMLRKLDEDQYLEFENGNVKYSATELRSPAPPSRKITILGDCCGIDDALKDLSKNSDVLVHELTNPGLTELHDVLQACDDDIMRKRGHSNCSIVAEHLRELRPKRVYLNHISQKYSEYFPVNSETGKMSVKPEFVDVIRRGIFQNLVDSKPTAEKDVYVAYDGLRISVPVDNTVVKDWQKEKGIPPRGKNMPENKYKQKAGRGFWHSIKSIFQS